MNTDAINLWQVQVEAGQPEANMQKIREQAENTQKSWILILPEMIIPGYMIWDDWLNDSYIKHCKDFNEEIIELSAKFWITIVWGNIDYDESKKNEDSSTRKYNASYMVNNWELLKTQYKTLLPNYRMFDDKRYFTSLKDMVLEEKLEDDDFDKQSFMESLEEHFKPVELFIQWVKTKVSMLICEDIWNINWDYAIDPLEMVKKYKPDLIAVSSASPFWVEKAKFRDKLLKIQSLWTSIAYVNPTWIQNNGKNIFNFDGGSSIYKDWEFVRWVKDYAENLGYPQGVHPTGIINELEHPETMEQTYNALVYVIKEFWKQNGWEKAMIGLSWGLDSWLVVTLLTAALWKENITAINMPSQFNWDKTKNLASQLAENLEIDYKISSIEKIVEAQIEDYIELTWEEPSSFEIENIQARTRWMKLSNFVSKFWPYTNNWNKDEILTGYATLYWDVNWVLAILWDLNKDTVRELSRWINENKADLIPSEMIEMQPAAELSEEQNVDNGGWDPFDYKILKPMSRAFVEKRLSASDLINKINDWTLEEFLWLEDWYLEQVFDTKDKQKDEVKRIWRMKTISYFKRVQSPPVITIWRRSYGFDLREAQNKPYFWEDKVIDLIIK